MIFSQHAAGYYGMLCKLNVYIVKYQIGFKTRNRKQQIYFVIVIGVTEI